MGFEMTPVQEDDKEILRNLMEKYDYEFSQYDGADVNAMGLYGYSYLDHYWTESGRWAFFLKVDGKLAGFVMVITRAEVGVTDYTMAEFFVMYKYRRCGLGRWAAYQAFERFQGAWQLKRHPGNLPSVGFWDRVVGDYTGGAYRLESRPDLCYPDGAPADLFFFDTRKATEA